MDEPRRVCSKCGNSYAPDVIFCPKDGTPLSAKRTEVADDPYLELSVQDQFRIEQLIGIGAMGRVYRAHQTGIEREVAIKILHRELLRNETVMARFHREAKVASRLTHPNVVQILMTGSLAKHNADVGGEAYLVMEHLDGISLRSALAATGGSLPLPRSLHIILQVCDAVGEAHDQGVVHRDLKPENVMLVRRGDDKDFVKVLDFGVARIEWADSTVATQAGSIFGTARYISPEGAQGETVGPASDVYSIATMLYQCLSGETPFDGESPVAILVKQTSEQAQDLRRISRASYVPEPIAEVILDNLAKDPGARCPNGREFGRALVEAARTSGLSPADLVVRSTLLGGTGALSLQSIQRTRALKLTPELQSQMEGPKLGPSGTAVVESETPAPPESTVEPTVSDEPVDDAVRASLPPASDQVRPSFPDSDWQPATEDPDSGPRRAAVILLCFVVGAGLAIAGAQQLGVFDEPEAPRPDAAPSRATAASTPAPTAVVAELPAPRPSSSAGAAATLDQPAPGSKRGRRKARPSKPPGTKPSPDAARDAGAPTTPPPAAPGGRWL